MLCSLGVACQRVRACAHAYVRVVMVRCGVGMVLMALPPHSACVIEDVAAL